MSGNLVISHISQVRIIALVMIPDINQDMILIMLQGINLAMIRTMIQGIDPAMITTMLQDINLGMIPVIPQVINPDMGQIMAMVKIRTSIPFHMRKKIKKINK